MIRSFRKNYNYTCYILIELKKFKFISHICNLFSNFKIYWSVPTNFCRKYNIDFVDLTTTGQVIQNTNDSLR